VIKRFFARADAVFLLVCAWKIVLLAISAQPVPSNDAFFYDGPVVNFLLHGKYVNPSLALAFPISGTEVFSAYPPLYQGALMAWMKVFGTSAITAITFHLVLFASYGLLLLAILRRLQLPTWAIQIASAFLLIITFHDRPDSLAHVFGVAAVYAWVRSSPSLNTPGTSKTAPAWAWGIPVFVVLSFASGLQIGAVYCLMLWIGTMLASIFAREKFPIVPMALTALVPVALASLVAVRYPHLFAGFKEHAQQTPSLTGWRVPKLPELLKLFRTTPGVLAVGAMLPWLFIQRDKVVKTSNVRLWLVTMACTLGALAILAGSMVLVTPNAVFFAAYIQPVVVGCYLTLVASLLTGGRLLQLQVWGLLALVALGSIRMVGMSTWGIACATDVGYPTAIASVRKELEGCRGGTAILSSAFLYEGARHSDTRWIHSDWLKPAERGTATKELEGLIDLKPAKIILTQFDYYRRYEAVLDKLKARPELVEIQIENSAKTRPPDSYRALQQVVQHVSWAPVIVNLSWK
jgi:hypothetical protein